MDIDAIIAEVMVRIDAAEQTVDPVQRMAATCKFLGEVRKLCASAMVVLNHAHARELRKVLLRARAIVIGCCDPSLRGDIVGLFVGVLQLVSFWVGRAGKNQPLEKAMEAAYFQALILENWVQNFVYAQAVREEFDRAFAERRKLFANIIATADPAMFVEPLGGENG